MILLLTPQLIVDGQVLGTCNNGPVVWTNNNQLEHLNSVPLIHLLLRVATHSSLMLFEQLSFLELIFNDGVILTCIVWHVLH